MMAVTLVAKDGDTVTSANTAAPSRRLGCTPARGTPTSGRPRVAVHCYHKGMGLDERTLFTKQPETRPGRYKCPRCRRTGEYRIRWVRHSKKGRLPAGADAHDRAKFAKLRDYLLRVDDDVTCKTCGKRFEIPSQHSLLFVDQLAGLPNDEDLEREINAASGEPELVPDSKPELPARFTRKSSGWK